MDNGKYLKNNVLKALCWLGFYVLLYLLYKRFVQVDYLEWLKPISNNHVLVCTLFLVSEIIVGIIPPEIFIIWSLKFDAPITFILMVACLATASYVAGVIGYFIGKLLGTTKCFKYLQKRFMKKLARNLQRFGLYFIILASLTPLPFSGVAMLVGSVRFSFRKYLLFSLCRFMRFILYSLIFWNLKSV